MSDLEFGMSQSTLLKLDIRLGYPGINQHLISLSAQIMAETQHPPFYCLQ